jgi:hypothetical protein
MSEALERLKNLTAKISGIEITRKENLKELESLYFTLKLDQKISKFEELFTFTAVNLSGIALDEENIGTIKEGKYLQLLAIYPKKEKGEKSKNLNLGYYGRVEKVDETVRRDIVAFVIRWRFEKSFMGLEHYKELLERV